MGKPLGRWFTLGTHVDAGATPQWERSSSEIEHAAEFIQLREKYPLQARLFLAFFTFADDAIESMIERHDALAARESVKKMVEVSTWLNNTSAPRVDEQLAELFGTLVRAGVPMEQVAGILQNRLKKGKGAPVCRPAARTARSHRG
jgi:hypothetical protein